MPYQVKGVSETPFKTKSLSEKLTDFIVFRLGSCYYLVHTYDSIQLKCKGCMVLSWRVPETRLTFFKFFYHQFRSNGGDKV